MKTPLAIALSLVVVAPLGGCKKKEDKPAAGSTTGGGGGTSGGTGGTPIKPLAALQPLGVLDATPRLSSDAGKALSAAWKAYKAKSWEEAKAQFSTVIQAAPDYLPARWALVRTFNAAGMFGDVPAAFEQVIARDYIGFAKKLDEGKEFAPLRAAPEWTQIGALKARYLEAYQKDAEKGFFVVVRDRPAADPKWGDKDAPLDQKQEAYHYDPDTKRFRRVTDTGGHVQGILPSKDGKSVAFATVKKLARNSPTDPELVAEITVGVFDFDELALTGPATYKGSPTEHVILVQTKDGGWHFGFKDGTKDKFFSFDTAKTGLVELDIDADAVFAGKTVIAAKDLTYIGHLDEGSVETKSDKQFIVQGSPTVIVAARPIASGSFAWSPKKNRIAYAGALDPCALNEAKDAAAKEAAAKKKKGAVVDADKGKNELFYFDKAKNAATRVALGVSNYTSRWVDEDRIAFDEGLGGASHVIVYSIVDHGPATLQARFGSGLYGIPAASCKSAPVEPTEPAPTDSEGEAVPPEEAD